MPVIEKRSTITAKGQTTVPKAVRQVLGVKEGMLTTSERGMQTFDTALLNLYRENRIDIEEALSNADSRTNLEARINFG